MEIVITLKKKYFTVELGIIPPPLHRPPHPQKLP